MRIDNLFQEWNNDSVPGCAVGIIKDGKIIYNKGYGIANLEYKVPVKTSTPIFVASSAKQFTAFLIYKLIEEEKISLKDDIRKYIPELPDYGETIEIQHLIHHTSGLRDYFRLLAKAGIYYDDIILKEYVYNLIKAQKHLNFYPGEEYQYSNTNYFLLSEIIETITGKKFSDYAQSEIFDPLGMQNTFFEPYYNKIIPKRAYSYYSDKDDRYRNNRLNDETVGATGLYSSSEDLLKWLINLETGYVGGKKVINQMYEKGTLNNGDSIHYAGGIGIVDYKGTILAGHGGLEGGFSSYICRYPEYNLSITIISNLGTFNCLKKAQEIGDIYIPDITTDKADPADRNITDTHIISDELAKEYTGIYYDERKCYKIEINESNDGLIYKINESSQFKLLPMNDSLFLLGDWVPCDTVLFVRSRKNNETRMELTTWQNIHFSFDRYKHNFAAISLMDYEGIYYCNEINTVYKLQVKDNSLKIIHPRIQEITLSPLSEELFLGDIFWLKHLRFERNENTGIAGFKTSCDRVRNLYFEKF